MFRKYLSSYQRIHPCLVAFLKVIKNPLFNQNLLKNTDFFFQLYVEARANINYFNFFSALSASKILFHIVSCCWHPFKCCPHKDFTQDRFWSFYVLILWVTFLWSVWASSDVRSAYLFEIKGGRREGSGSLSCTLGNGKLKSKITCYKSKIQTKTYSKRKKLNILGFLLITSDISNSLKIILLA